MSSKKRIKRISSFKPYGSDNVTCTSISKYDGQLVVTGNERGLVSLFKLKKIEKKKVIVEKLADLHGHNNEIRSVAISPKEEYVVAGSFNGSIRLWQGYQNKDDIQSKPFKTGHRSSVSILRFNPKVLEVFASGSTDTNIKLWSIKKRACICDFREHTAEITAMEWSPDGLFLITGDKLGIIKVWDYQKEKIKFSLHQHTNEITCFGFHPLEGVISTGSKDKTGIIFDIFDKSILCKTQRSTYSVDISLLLHNKEAKDTKTLQDALLCISRDIFKVWKIKPLKIIDSDECKMDGIEEYYYNRENGRIVIIAAKKNTVNLYMLKANYIAPFRIPTQNSVPGNKVRIRKLTSGTKLKPRETIFSDNELIKNRKEKKKTKPETMEPFRNEKIKISQSNKTQETKKLHKLDSYDEKNVLDALLSNNNTMGILNLRKIDYNLMKRLWFKSDDSRKHALKNLLKSKDIVLKVHVVRSIFLGENGLRFVVFSLCKYLLELQLEFLNSPYEDVISNGLRFTKIIHKRFWERAKKAREGDEDYENAKKCRKFFKLILKRLEVLEKNPKVFGETVSDSSKFLLKRLNVGK